MAVEIITKKDLWEFKKRTAGRTYKTTRKRKL